MREIVAGKGIKPGTRLDGYIMSTFPAMPRNALYKAFRMKDIKINGKWVAADAILKPGDVIRVYISDEILFGKPHVKEAITNTVGAGSSRPPKHSECIADTNTVGAGSSRPPKHTECITDTDTVGAWSSRPPKHSECIADTNTVGAGSSRPPKYSACSDIVGEGSFSVAYEDDRLLIVNKACGLAVHPDKNGRGVTLIELVREYLNKPDFFAGGMTPPLRYENDTSIKKHTSSELKSLPAGTPYVTERIDPAMCHRIDRNTGGLVMIAKDKLALDLILSKISSNEIIKEYRCIVSGRPKPSEATLYAYMSKDAAHGKAYVYADRQSAPKNAFRIATKYRTLSYDKAGDTSKLEVRLLTGRTHQIRAHLAFCGHPIIGDGKYCPNAICKRYREPYQMLVAFRLKFPIIPGMQISGMTVEIPDGLYHPIIKP